MTGGCYCQPRWIDNRHYRWSKPEVKQATYRIDAIRNGGLTDEAEVLSQRFPEATICLAGSDELTEADYPEMTAELNEIFEEAALGLAELGLSRAAGDADRRLEHSAKADRSKRYHSEP